jgi:hypothetical protein
MLPPYPGVQQIVKLPSAAVAGGSSEVTLVTNTAVASTGQPASPADMRVSYELHGLLEDDVMVDPLQQFDQWFQAAVEAQVSSNTLQCLYCLLVTLLL